MDNKEQNERLKNFLLFKMYNTDKEMEDIAPLYLKGFILVIIIFVFVVLFNLIF